VKPKRPACSAVVDAGDRDSGRTAFAEYRQRVWLPRLNPKKPMSNGTILVVLKRMGIRAG